MASKEAKKKLKEEKKRQKEEDKKRKKEAKERAKKGFVGSVISGPVGFSHDTHVGWDTENGFEVRNIPAEWRRLFQQAGVKKSDLADPETRKVLVNTVRESIMMSRSPLEGGGGGDVPPPPPPPPPPPSGGSAPPAIIPKAAPKPPEDPLSPGKTVKAIWSGDGQWYDAVVDSVRQEGGEKYYSVTFAGYGDKEELDSNSVYSEAADASSTSSSYGGGPADLTSLLKAQASKLSAPDLTQISHEEEGNIVDSVQKALAARRAGMCFSVYGHDAVDDQEWSDDESWLDY